MYHTSWNNKYLYNFRQYSNYGTGGRRKSTLGLNLLYLDISKNNLGPGVASGIFHVLG